MAEVNAKDLTTKTTPASTDSMLLFGTSTNEGSKITVDNLAENILSRLSTKTFPNQVGGSSAATILAQLATLNSKLFQQVISQNYTFTAANTWELLDLEYTPTQNGFLVVQANYGNSPVLGLAVGNGATISNSIACVEDSNKGGKTVILHVNKNQTYRFLLKGGNINTNGNILYAWFMAM